ncbi:MAG: tail fiber domain-containing protein [Pyrinomonadaceae bacterium]
MKNQRSFSLGLSALFLIACLQSAAPGQTASQEATEVKLANMSGQGLSVRWDVSAPHSALTVTISGPDGRVFRREYKAGKSPEFTLTDKDGERLPDGQYTYELRLSPVLSAGLKEQLKVARGRDDEAENVRAERKRGIAPAQALVQSGSFAILNGAVIVAGAQEETGARPAGKVTAQPRSPSVTSAALTNLRQHHAFSVAMRSAMAMPDQVIPDDLIVQGSACVGLDCVSGEVFGFDTIRMKENNTRLQFDDTSAAAGFPTNNWQIRANSSANGGANFLAFVDQGASGNSETGTIVLEVDAGAPANSLRVSSTGKVGLRTATPVLDVHINTSDTPAHRLEQNSSGGFTAQTWDVAGNEANFFVRDVTGGSRLPFRIRPGAPTSSIDISANGDVGIGTASPLARLHAFSTATADVFGGFGPDPAAGPALNFGYAGASIGRGAAFFNVRPDASAVAPNPSLRFLTVNVERMIITNAGNVGIGTSAPTDTLSVSGTASKTGGGSWAVFSDERLKTIKGRFNSGLKAVMQLQPIRYEYRPGNVLGLKAEEEYVGFGAQAVQKVIPEAVTRNQNGYLQINNDPILWTMLNAIKEQQAQIQQLQEEVRQLRAARGKHRK